MNTFSEGVSIHALWFQMSTCYTIPSIKYHSASALVSAVIHLILLVVFTQMNDKSDVHGCISALEGRPPSPV